MNCYKRLALESWYTNLEQLQYTVVNLFLLLTKDYSTKNLKYTLILSQLTTYCDLPIKTGVQLLKA